MKKTSQDKRTLRLAQAREKKPQYEETLYQIFLLLSSNVQ